MQAPRRDFGNDGAKNQGSQRHFGGGQKVFGCLRQ